MFYRLPQIINKRCSSHATAREGQLVCNQFEKHLSKHKRFKNQGLTLKGGRFQFYGIFNTFLSDARRIEKS